MGIGPYADEVKTECELDEIGRGIMSFLPNILHFFPYCDLLWFVKVVQFEYCLIIDGHNP